MVYIGMIFQYDVDNAAGLLMLSNGDQKSFTSDDWTDKINAPAVGQKIAYEDTADEIQVRVATELDINGPSSEIEVAKSVEEHVAHFTSIGFNLVKESQSDGSRTLTLRSFANEESEEVLIKETASKITLTQTINGKVIT